MLWLYTTVYIASQTVEAPCMVPGSNLLSPTEKTPVFNKCSVRNKDENVNLFSLDKQITEIKNFKYIISCKFSYREGKFYAFSNFQQLFFYKKKVAGTKFGQLQSVDLMRKYSFDSPLSLSYNPDSINKLFIFLIIAFLSKCSILTLTSLRFCVTFH